LTESGIYKILSSIMNVETKAAAFFNIFNANVIGQVEGDDTTGPFQYLGDSPTNCLVSADQALTVTAEWHVGGLIPAMSKLDYTLTLFVDGAPVATSLVTAGPLAPGTTATYTSSVVMPSGSSVGVHGLKMTLTVKVNGVGGLHLPVAGFQDLGNIQVYPA
jgi:hypothetical protein